MRKPRLLMCSDFVLLASFINNVNWPKVLEDNRPFCGAIDIRGVCSFRWMLAVCPRAGFHTSIVMLWEKQSRGTWICTQISKTSAPLFWSSGDVSLGFRARVNPLLIHLSPACNGFLRFTSTATLFDILTSMATDPFPHLLFQAEVGGHELRQFSSSGRVTTLSWEDLVEHYWYCYHRYVPQSGWCRRWHRRWSSRYLPTNQLKRHSNPVTYQHINVFRVKILQHSTFHHKETSESSDLSFTISVYCIRIFKFLFEHARKTESVLLNFLICVLIHSLQFYWKTKESNGNQIEGSFKYWTRRNDEEPGVSSTADCMWTTNLIKVYSSSKNTEFLVFLFQFLHNWF